MKTVFEGIINDEKFDNVKDYNARMTSLISEGKSVNASSTTRIVNDETEPRKQLVPEKININELTPLFEDFDEINNRYDYIDSKITDDADLDIKKLTKEMNDMFDDSFAKIEEAYNNGQFNDLDFSFNLVARISNILKALKEDHDDNAETLCEVEKQLKTLKNAELYIDKLYRFYLALADVVKCYVLNLKKIK